MTDIHSPTAVVTPVCETCLDSIPDAVAAIARGDMIVLVDDEDRENEGDLVVAAEYATDEVINFMITHAKGLVCAPITPHRAEELRLPLMVDRNEDPHGTAFTVSVDGGPEHGVTTGISAADRAATVALLHEGKAGDLRRPGHVFPLIARAGGTLERPGHTEASVDLARLADLDPGAVIVEVIKADGQMARLPDLVEFAREHGLVLTSIELLREFLLAQTQLEGVA
ncbi:3,4-dihydroxy-2-butanone-4-phosphate synthase [Kribbella sp. NBC_00359]|uniref:3,4-dihydroxy-2-butanone-4-phosphate synthase n=1 Tax=Kribbella sp. NBC_00359 TaxID=2975966 RepID=UPI002E1CD6EA